MEYYSLNQDTYIVTGAMKHCIYDLLNGNLYNITQLVLDVVNKLLNDKNVYLELESQEKEIADELIKLAIIIESNKKEDIADIISLRQKPIPLFAWLEVTRKCNLACTFCYEESNPHCTERMSLDDFYHVINELKETGVKKIQFIGGEPMVLRNDLKTMIEYCHGHFDFIEVYSNGILITEEWAKFFKEHNIAVALSIHSYIPEEHDRLTTVKGSHKRVLRGLELLKKYQVPYRIGTVRSASCDLGTQPVNAGYTLKPKEPKVVGRADLSQYDLDMFKRKAITKQSKSYPISKDSVITALSGHQCFIKDLYISSELNVYPCVMERRLTHGNLKDQKLKNIINDKIRFLSKDNIEGCKNCEFRYACFDCRPDSNGKGLYQKPWYCTYNPLEAKWHGIEATFEKLNRGVSRIGSIPVVVEMI